jgi:predicted nucleotidyltransferase
LKVLGIIAEYNPFHNGHLYHLKKSLEITGATHTVAIMSGHFLQRGQPALVNKWARAEMAVRSGIDLVLELPVVYCCRSAQAFAHGSVSILDKTAAIDCISFGSESGDISELDKVASLLADEPPHFKEKLRQYLDTGLSFPAARSMAVQSAIGTVAGLLINPNNILGIEYLKALKRFNSPITPYTVERKSAHYNSTWLSGPIASATAIRRDLLAKRCITDGIAKAIPAESLKILTNELTSGRGPVDERAFDLLLIGSIRKMRPMDLLDIDGVSEGLEHRIWQAARDHSSVIDMLAAVKSKRYTLTRLKRILVHILLDIRAPLLSQLEASSYPGYARILAVGKNGRDVLRRMNRTSRIAVINKTARHRFKNDSLTKSMLDIDLLASDIYVLGYPNGINSRAGQDYVTSPVCPRDVY